MTSKERVIRAIKFQNPDRLPVDLWYPLATTLKYGNAFETLRKERDYDFERAPFNDPTTDERHFKKGSYTDSWGSLWMNHQDGIMGEVKKYPLDDYDKLVNYNSPISLLDGKGFEETEQFIIDNNNKFILGGWISIFERMQFLRGTENLYMDLAEDCDELYELRQIVWDFYKKYLSQWLKFDIDAVCFGDDYGSQTSLLISKKTFQKVFKPVYLDLFKMIKQSGKYIFFHSDGYIMELYDEFIEMGVDAINSQLFCMGVEKVAERFAGKICFWGEISRQDTLPYGTQDDIQMAADLMKKHLYVNGGGLIGQCEAGADVPFENIRKALYCW
jgi:uroporphyrinogen decarboxylase